MENAYCISIISVVRDVTKSIRIGWGTKMKWGWEVLPWILYM